MAATAGNAGYYSRPPTNARARGNAPSLSRWRFGGVFDRCTKRSPIWGISPIAPRGDDEGVIEYTPESERQDWQAHDLEAVRRRQQRGLLGHWDSADRVPLQPWDRADSWDATEGWRFSPDDRADTARLEALAEAWLASGQGWPGETGPRADARRAELAAAWARDDVQPSAFWTAQRQAEPGQAPAGHPLTPGGPALVHPSEMTEAELLHYFRTANARMLGVQREPRDRHGQDTARRLPNIRLVELTPEMLEEGNVVSVTDREHLPADVLQERIPGVDGRRRPWAQPDHEARGDVYGWVEDARETLTEKQRVALDLWLYPATSERPGLGVLPLARQLGVDESSVRDRARSGARRLMRAGVRQLLPEREVELVIRTGTKPGFDYTAAAALLDPILPPLPERWWIV